MMMLGLSDAGRNDALFRPFIRQGIYRTVTSRNDIGVNNIVPSINGGVNNVGMGGQVIVQGVRGNYRTMPAPGTIVYARRSRINPSNNNINNNVIRNNNIYNNDHNIGNMGRTRNSGFIHSPMAGPTSLRGSGTISTPLVDSGGRMAPGSTIASSSNVDLGSIGVGRVSRVIDPSVATQESVRGATGHGVLISIDVGQNAAPLGHDLTGQNNRGLRQVGTVGEALTGPATGLQASTVLGPSNIARRGALPQPAIRGRSGPNLVQRVYTPMTERNAIGNYNAVQNVNNRLNTGSAFNTIQVLVDKQLCKVYQETGLCKHMNLLATTDTQG